MATTASIPTALHRRRPEMGLLGTSQGTGIIDFTQETAGYVDVYTSPYSGVYL